MLGICAVSKNQTECGPTQTVVHSSLVFSSNKVGAREFPVVVSDVQTRINPPLIAVAGIFFLAAVVARLSLTLTVKSDADNRFHRIIFIYRLYIGLVTLSAAFAFWRGYCMYLNGGRRKKHFEERCRGLKVRYQREQSPHLLAVSHLCSSSNFLDYDDGKNTQGIWQLRLVLWLASLFIDCWRLFRSSTFGSRLYFPGLQN
jgi:hypothetical protein